MERRSVCMLIPTCIITINEVWLTSSQVILPTQEWEAKETGYGAIRRSIDSSRRKYCPPCELWTNYAPGPPKSNSSHRTHHISDHPTPTIHLRLLSPRPSVRGGRMTLMVRQQIHRILCSMSTSYPRRTCLIMFAHLSVFGIPPLIHRRSGLRPFYACLTPRITPILYHTIRIHTRSRTIPY